MGDADAEMEPSHLNLDREAILSWPMHDIEPQTSTSICCSTAIHRASKKRLDSQGVVTEPDKVGTRSVRFKHKDRAPTHGFIIFLAQASKKMRRD
jgi:hypothetical protein